MESTTWGEWLRSLAFALVLGFFACVFYGENSGTAQAADASQRPDYSDHSLYHSGRSSAQEGCDCEGDLGELQDRNRSLDEENFDLEAIIRQFFGKPAGDVILDLVVQAKEVEDLHEAEIVRLQGTIECQQAEIASLEDQLADLGRQLADRDQQLIRLRTAQDPNTIPTGMRP